MRYLPYVLVASAIGLTAAACGSDADKDADDKGSSGASGSLGSSGAASSSGAVATCAATAKGANRAEVDIIFVIDTSGSMGEETEQVKQNINDFAQSIGNTGLDYNVIMIANKQTGPSVPFGQVAICVPPPLAGANCADGPKFHHLAESVGSSNSLETLLEEFPKYSAWLRPSAYKVFVEVTDDNSRVPHAEFDQKLLATSAAQFGDAQQRRYIFNAICGYKRGTPVLSAQKCESAVNIGEDYQRLSQLTGGTVESVCEKSYATVFDNIAKGLVTKLGCEFSYPKAENGQDTDPTTVMVTYTPGDGSASKPLTQVTDESKCGANPDGWYYDRADAPTKILFCPSTCSGPGADLGGKLDVKVGCAAPPPK